MARSSSLPERIDAIRVAVAAQTEPLVTLTHLLQLCRDEHPVLWERVNDPLTRSRVASLVAEIRPLLPNVAVEVQALDPQVRRAFADALGRSNEVPAVVVAHALAELIDERYASSFTESFRQRSPYRPRVGDPIPLDSPDLREVTALPATSPPWRLANRLDETRHIRLAGEWAAQFQVIFDYSLANVLTGLMGPDTIIATCHPNRTLRDFDFPVDAMGLTFPVHPIDEARQRREIDRLIGIAVAAGATVVVLPELCVTESLAAQLQNWTCRADGLRLLVAGSYHHDDHHASADQALESGSLRRRNTAIAYLRGCPAALTHDKHSPADRPVNEDIAPQGWPELRVHVSRDGWHLVIAICRDLLNPHAVHALTEAGVNLALVPAMSETLVAFGGPVAHMVSSSQAFVAVANNPADFANAGETTARRPARALFGHPGFAQQTRLIQPADGEPGVALLHVQTGRLQWLPGTQLHSHQRGGDGVMRVPGSPDWVVKLSRRVGPSLSRQTVQPDRITLRTASVLVLLTDSADGPAVLLSERAQDLTHYPGQLVFPGGAAEPGDDGPVNTALREAAEEIGLDSASVHVLGLLPALALPDSGFLLTPVLAWSPRPVFTNSGNLAEVTSITTVALRQLADSATTPSANEAAAEEPSWNLHVGALGAVTGVLIDLLTGMLTATEDPHGVGADREPMPA